ncbi:MAG: PIN domain-containing protein [Nitrospirae bacterium]|nr:PIN domain-containing protein [Nitrospirota bacterium]
MKTGIDTGFFFSLEIRDPIAMKVWDERTEVVTSVVVMYELQKKLLQGSFEQWASMIEDIQKAVTIVPLTVEAALKAGHLAHDLKIPGLDALILSSLINAGCIEIYTTDSHFEAYKKRGVRIINLEKS